CKASARYPVLSRATSTLGLSTVVPVVVIWLPPCPTVCPLNPAVAPVKVRPTAARQLVLMILSSLRFGHCRWVAPPSPRAPYRPPRLLRHHRHRVSRSRCP